MEDAGAFAVVLHSLFEEQIRYERYDVNRRQRSEQRGTCVFVGFVTFCGFGAVFQGLARISFRVFGVFSG